MFISARGLDSTLHVNIKSTGWVEAELEGHATLTCRRTTTIAPTLFKNQYNNTGANHIFDNDALVLKDSLPMRRDAAWFRNTFLKEICPDSRCQRNEMWPHVKGFNTALLNIFP